MLGSRLVGPFQADAAASLTVRDSAIDGPVTIEGTTGAIVLAGNEIAGPLRCYGNAEPPSNEGVPTVVTGLVLGQCAGLTGDG